jgi:hypothetical protein
MKAIKRAVTFTITALGEKQNIRATYRLQASCARALLACCYCRMDKLTLCCLYHWSHLLREGQHDQSGKCIDLFSSQTWHARKQHSSTDASGVAVAPVSVEECNFLQWHASKPCVCAPWLGVPSRRDLFWCTVYCIHGLDRDDYSGILLLSFLFALCALHDTENRILFSLLYALRNTFCRILAFLLCALLPIAGFAVSLALYVEHGVAFCTLCNGNEGRPYVSCLCKSTQELREVCDRTGLYTACVVRCLEVYCSCVRITFLASRPWDVPPSPGTNHIQLPHHYSINPLLEQVYPTSDSILQDKEVTWQV